MDVLAGKPGGWTVHAACGGKVTDVDEVFDFPARRTLRKKLDIPDNAFISCAAEFLGQNS